MKRLLLLPVVAALAGCWTFNETEILPVAVKALPQGKSLAVQVAGFDATVTTYSAVYGHATVVGGCGYGPYGRHGCWPTMVTTETIIPQTASTPAFRDRAVETLERCGFVVQSTAPKYRIEVTFAGPFVSDADTWKQVAWNVLSLLTADYAAQGWTAKLKIHELATGKLVLMRDYVQDYHVNVWGLVPLFSPGACDKTKFAVLQGLCLTALTDQALADATDYLSARAQ